MHGLKCCDTFSNAHDNRKRVVRPLPWTTPKVIAFKNHLRLGKLSKEQGAKCSVIVLWANCLEFIFPFMGINEIHAEL